MHDLRVRVCVSVKVLLVTTLLSLVTMFDTVRNNSPDALELKCIEVNVLFHPLNLHVPQAHSSLTCTYAHIIVITHFRFRLTATRVRWFNTGLMLQVWLISCILFVFLALMEYFIVLFGIRYDKHWRTENTKKQSIANIAAAAFASTAATASASSSATTTTSSNNSAALAPSTQPQAPSISLTNSETPVGF